MLETERLRISGWLMLPRGGYRSRMSDFLNSAEVDFLSLTDATIEPLDSDREAVRHDHVAVARRHVVYATELYEDGPERA